MPCSSHLEVSCSFLCVKTTPTQCSVKIYVCLGTGMVVVLDASGGIMVLSVCMSTRRRKSTSPHTWWPSLAMLSNSNETAKPALETYGVEFNFDNVNEFWMVMMLYLCLVLLPDNQETVLLQ